jgi:hypothetical protein
VSRSAIVSASRSNTVMNGGIWSSYTLRSVTEGMFWWSAVGAVNRSRYLEANYGLAVCVKVMFRVFAQGVETQVGFHLGQVLLKLCVYV